MLQDDTFYSVHVQQRTTTYLSSLQSWSIDFAYNQQPRVTPTCTDLSHTGHSKNLVYSRSLGEVWLQHLCYHTPQCGRSSCKTKGLLEKAGKLNTQEGDTATYPQAFKHFQIILQLSSAFNITHEYSGVQPWFLLQNSQTQMPFPRLSYCSLTHTV